MKRFSSMDRREFFRLSFGALVATKLRIPAKDVLRSTSLTDVENALELSIMTSGAFDPKVLIAAKCEAIKKSGAFLRRSPAKNPKEKGSA
jgi:hypothetical protein